MILSNNQFFFSLLFSFLHFLLYMLLAIMAAVIFPKASTLLLAQPWSTIELIIIHNLEFLRIIDLENIFHPSLIFHFKFKNYSWSWRNFPTKWQSLKADLPSIYYRQLKMSIKIIFFQKSAIKKGTKYFQFPLLEARINLMLLYSWMMIIVNISLLLFLYFIIITVYIYKSEGTEETEKGQLISLDAVGKFMTLIFQLKDEKSMASSTLHSFFMITGCHHQHVVLFNTYFMINNVIAIARYIIKEFILHSSRFTHTF